MAESADCQLPDKPARREGRLTMSKYIRKTRDYWDVQQHTSRGWETVDCFDSLTSARFDLTSYRTEQPELPARIKKGREPIAS